jgi:hypothetical protein
MKISSAAQLEIDRTGVASAQSTVVEPTLPQPSALGVVQSLPPTIEVPAYNDLYAAASRAAGRLNASAVSEEEHLSLLDERKTLVVKELAGRITRKEAVRLQYIRWSLDRIDDAKHGQDLDRLEQAVVEYERFLSDLEDLKRDISGLREENTHRPRGRNESQKKAAKASKTSKSR